MPNICKYDNLEEVVNGLNTSENKQKISLKNRNHIAKIMLFLEIPLPLLTHNLSQWDHDFNFLITEICDKRSQNEYIENLSNFVANSLSVIRYLEISVSQTMSVNSNSWFRFVCKIQNLSIKGTLSSIKMSSMYAMRRNMSKGIPQAVKVEIILCIHAV